MRELSLNVMDVAQNSVRAEASLVTITVEESDKNDSLSISIEDNGCGMTEEQVQSGHRSVLYHANNKKGRTGSAAVQAVGGADRRKL